MKFGVIMHTSTQNIGDDIQTYAAKCHLPSVDYFIDRECLDVFETPDGKPVATIMAAWYMWHKWNWPPSKYIVPLFTGIHFSDHQSALQVGSPVQTQFLEGCGKEYMNVNGPVGCRDLYTLKKFKKIGLDAFFSGCITLTLPKMEKKKPEREYVCAVDLPKDILAKLKNELEKTDIDIIETTHEVNYQNNNMTWKQREEAVKKLLTIYQNAKCVVTRRLHCALPCLAMEVPVFVTNKHKRPVSGRFDPYYDWISNCSYEEFLDGKFNYDFSNPPPNSTAYLEVREAMIKSINDFVEKYKDEDGDAEEYIKTSYSDEEFYRWKCDTMRSCMNEWFKVTVSEEKRIKKQKIELRNKSNQIAHMEKLLDCKSIKFLLAIRNAFVKLGKKLKH